MSRRTGTLLSYLFIVVEIISTLFLTPLIISSLGNVEYGVYKLISSISGYLLLLDLGIGNSVIRYIAKYKETKDIDGCKKFLGVCTIFYAFIAIIVLLLGYILIISFQDVFARGLSSDEIVLGKKLLSITTINAAIILGTSVWGNTLIGYSKFIISKGVAIFQVVFRVIITVLALTIGFRSLALVTINLLLTIVTRLYYVLYVFYVLKLSPKFKNINFAFIKEIFMYSFFVFLQMIATQINAFADQILIGIFVSSSAGLIAVYGIGTQIVQYFQSIGNAMGGILMPGVVKMTESGATIKQLQDEMVRIGRLSLIVLGIVFIGFIANGKMFIELWVGNEYVESYYVAAILMFAYMIISAENIGSQILWAKNMHQLQAIIKLCVVVVNIVLTIFLIRWNPIIGASIGTFIALMLGDIVCMNIVFKTKIGILLMQYYRDMLYGILPCIIITGIGGYLISLLELQGICGLIFNVGIMIILYSVTLWVWGLNSYEKDLLRRTLKIIDYKS